jgi:hypothetical protein
MATVKAIVDNHIQACVDTKHQIDEINLRELHKLIIENSIWGYDVVASAVHLTASTLALLSPEVSFDGMNLYCLPLGGNASRMGSIDFITEMAISSEKYKGGRRLPVQADLFGVDAQTEKVTGSGSQVNVAEIPPLDLCVMNPPFTRSVGGNLLFGSLPQSEKASLQKRLRELLKTPGILAQGTAGLGAVFVAVGDQLLKEKGRQALVLPLALLAGVAWKETRTLLSEKYSVEYIVVSHDPSQWNFSENTELSEVLVVARKTTDSEQSTTPTHWINLWRNPTTAVEAMSVCDEIKRMAETKNRIASLSETGISQIQEDGSTWGEVFTTDDGYQKDYLWWPYAFAQTELTRLSSRLARGELKLPGQPTSHKVPLCPLDQLGELGPDRRDIHDGFKKTDSSTPYAAFWGHDSNAVNSLIQEPNAFLAPLATPLEGRPKRPVELLWPKASHLLIAERMRLNTVRFPAIYVTTPVLSNVWWPFRVTANTNKEEVAKLLALWFSSTLGLLLLLLNREQTQGPWVDLKKPALRQLPVIDIGAIDTKEKKKLLATFDELANENWMLLCKMGNDPIRARIDNAFKDAFKLPDFSIIRTMLAKEPVITNKCLVGP